MVVEELGGHRLRSTVGCRWDEAGKTWYNGIIHKLRTKTVNKVKQKQAYIHFSDEKRWFQIRQGWIKKVKPADSEEEEYEDDDPAPKVTKAKKQQQKRLLLL